MSQQSVGFGVPSMHEERSATTLQAHARGRAERKRGGRMHHHPSYGSVLFPSQQKATRDALVDEITTAIASSHWPPPTRRDDCVLLSVLPDAEPTAKQPPAPRPPARPKPSPTYLCRVKSRSRHEAAAAIKLQARTRGRLARRRAAVQRTARTAEEFRGVRGYLLSHPGRVALLSPVCLLCFLLLSPTYVPLLLVAAFIYIQLRLPYLLGSLVSDLVTKYGTFGYPLRMRAIHVSPWLRRSPSWQLNIRIFVEDFSLPNPPEFVHPDFVSTKTIHTHVHVDGAMLAAALRYAWSGEMRTYTLAKGVTRSALGVVHMRELEVTGLNLVFEMEDAKLNINQLVRELADCEVRSTLRGGGGLLRAQPEAFPNLLRVSVQSVRLPKHPAATPRVLVTLRSRKVTTANGVPTGTASEWRFDEEYLLPLEDASTVVHVQVLDGSRLLGQWLITAKYLRTLPTHCKHSRIKVYPDSAIDGTFLLCDAALHGSTVRVLGPHSCGDGLVGEIDLRLHWAHAPVSRELLDLNVMKKSALSQITENSKETTLRLGNADELKRMLSRIPLLFKVDRLLFEDTNVHIATLFAGSHGLEKERSRATDGGDARQQPAGVHLDRLELRNLPSNGDDGVTLPELLNAFVEKVVPRILAKGGALLHAAAELGRGFKHLVKAKVGLRKRRRGGKKKPVR